MNENQPNDHSGRTIVIHLTHDTVLLTIALLLLIIAIMLIVFVPAAYIARSPLDGQAAVLDRAGRSPTEYALPSVTPGMASVLSAPSQPGGDASEPASLNAAYPEPTVAFLDPTSPGGPASPTLLPYFNPNRPTVVVGNALPTIDTSQLALRSLGSAYPAPAAIQPTVALPPTVVLPPTASAQLVVARAAPSNNSKTRDGATSRPVAPAQRTGAAPPKKTPSVIVVRGEVHWSQSLVLTRTYQIAADAILIIEPGVDVQIRPGVSIFVDGTLMALGERDRPVHITGDPGQRWEGIFGNPHSTISLKYTDIHYGGAGGTLLISEAGILALEHVNIVGNGGQIRVSDSLVDIRGSAIADNDMPYGSALEAVYTRGSAPRVDLLLNDSRIANNRLANGAAALQITNQQAPEIVILDLQRNTISSQSGPDLMLFAHGQLGGNVTCNAFVGAASGLGVRSNMPQTFILMLNIRDNAIEGHAPPLDPFYRQNRIGRGAASEIPFFMLNNWWGNPSGPYSPERHADGRGDAVGNTVAFEPWLKERPACVPHL